MRVHGLVHRLVLIVGVTAAMAAPAFAQRCATSSPDDAAARGVTTAVTPAVTAAPRPGLAAPRRVAAIPAAPAAAARADNRMRTPTTRNSRPGQRVKAATPRPAAAPGMGSLLKWTIGAGRDMSSLFDNNDTGDRADHIIAGQAAPGPGAVPNQLLPPFLTIASVQ